MRKVLFVVCVLGLCSTELWGMDADFKSSMSPSLDPVFENPRPISNSEQRKYKRQEHSRSYSERPNTFSKPGQRKRTSSERGPVPQATQNRKYKESYYKFRQGIYAKVLGKRSHTQSKTSSMNSSDTLVSSNPEISFDVCEIVEPFLSIEIENDISTLDLLKNNQTQLKLLYNGKDNVTVTVKTTNNWKAVSEIDSEDFIPYQGTFYLEDTSSQIVNENNASIIIDNNQILDNAYDLVLKLNPTIKREMLKAGTFHDHIVVSVEAM